MKKYLGVLAVLALVAAPAMANMGAIIDWPDAGYSHQPTGGVFKATVTDFTGYQDSILTHAPGTSFLTFCVEENEYFSPGSWYVVGLTNTAIAGGIGGGSPDPLSNAAAHLYLQYLGLSTADQMAKGADYQQAIWFLEDESTSSNKLAIDAMTAWGDKELVNYTGNAVKVMNLTDTSGALHQDMLVAVPAPAAFILGSLGLGLVGWVRRRMA